MRQNNGRTALAVAAIAGHTAVVELLRGRVMVDSFNMLVLAASLVVASYFFKVLGYIAGSNKQQRLHAGLLQEPHRRAVQAPGPRRDGSEALRR